MKYIKYILSSLLFLLMYSEGVSQCNVDDCNPLVVGSSYLTPCDGLDETNVYDLFWTIDALDLQCAAPAGSWKIKISFPTNGEYGIEDITAVDGPGFDWTYNDALKTLVGVTNQVTEINFITDFVQSSGHILVTTTANVVTDCTAIGTIANIQFAEAAEPLSCNEAFDNNIADDVDQTGYGVSPRNSIAGIVFLDNFADGTQGNNAGDGTGTDTNIGGITVTLINCGVDGICGNADDDPSKTTVTLPDGSYEFTGLANGDYQVSFGMNDGSTTYDEFTATNTGDAATDSDASSGASGGVTPIITLNSANSDVVNVDAGLFEYATITGTLFNDNDGTSGTVIAPNTTDDIIVTYCDDPPGCTSTTDVTYTVTTDGNGDYTIDNVIPGVITAINASSFNTFEESSVVNSQSLDAHSGGAITDQNFALPVSMLYFNASKFKNSSLLEWATAKEVNNEYFEIEHSINGLSFGYIGRVEGMGTTYKTTEYTFMHSQPEVGVNYYRLKQYDIDGRYDYSEVRAVTFESVNSLDFNVYPIPTYNFISLDVSEDLTDHEVVLFNKLGQHIKTFKFSNAMKIQMNNYSAGVYFVKLIDSNGSVIKKQKVINIR